MYTNENKMLKDIRYKLHKQPKYRHFLILFNNYLIFSYLYYYNLFYATILSYINSFSHNNIKDKMLIIEFYLRKKNFYANKIILRKLLYNFYNCF